MFTQELFPEGYQYVEPSLSHEELLEQLTQKMVNNEPVEGKLIYLSPTYTYGIICFGNDIYGYIEQQNLVINSKFALCLYNQIIKVNLLCYDTENKRFVCSRIELLNKSSKILNTYKEGYKLICKVLYVANNGFLIADMGGGISVKVFDDRIGNPNFSSEEFTFKSGDFRVFSIKKMVKKDMGYAFALSIDPKVGLVLPITITNFDEEANILYGCVENCNEFGLGIVIGLKQNAVYKFKDVHPVAYMGSKISEPSTPIYKLI